MLSDMPAQIDPELRLGTGCSVIEIQLEQRHRLLFETQLSDAPMSDRLLVGNVVTVLGLMTICGSVSQNLSSR